MRDVSRRQAHWHEWICTNTKGPIKCEHNKQGNLSFFPTSKSLQPQCLLGLAELKVRYHTVLSLVAAGAARPNVACEGSGVVFSLESAKEALKSQGTTLLGRPLALCTMECISTGLLSLKSFVIEGQLRLRHRTINRTGSHAIPKAVVCDKMHGT